MTEPQERCGDVSDDEGYVCQLDLGHDPEFHQDGRGDDWGVRWYPRPLHVGPPE